MPISSIYGPADMRFGNPAFNQNTGSMFPAAQNLTTLPGGGTTTGTGGTGSLPGQTSGPDLTSITELVNKLNRDAQTQANQARIPGAAGLEAKSSANIGDLLGGGIPLDVRNNLIQSGAERGVAMGSPGSDNANAALLRALGLTSLDLQQMGQQDLSAAYARNPVAKIFDPTTQLLTPYQAGDLAYKNAALNRSLISDFLNSGGAFPQGARHYGGGGPVYQGDPNSGGDQSWFPTTGGTPSPPYPGPIPGGGFVNDPNYPGTSMSGFPGLTSVLGTPDPGYGYSPDPFGQAPPTDYSNPSTWDFTGGTDLGGYDPFNQLGG